MILDLLLARLDLIVQNALFLNSLLAKNNGDFLGKNDPKIGLLYPLVTVLSLGVIGGSLIEGVGPDFFRSTRKLLFSRPEVLFLFLMRIL